MKDPLLTMLTMQDQMNSRVHPQWTTQNFEWYRAIWTECAELLDHYGWKWWKKQEPDMAQVKLELIDIWHFGLSILILSGGVTETIAEAAADNLTISEDKTDFREAIEDFACETLSTKSFSVSEFSKVMNAANMSFDELYVGYIGKNVLNFFRQDHGYKEGSYIKQWNGREDNEHLVEIVGSLDTSSPAFKDNLYAGLETRYASVVN